MNLVQTRDNLGVGLLHGVFHTPLGHTFGIVYRAVCLGTVCSTSAVATAAVVAASTAL